MTREQYDPLHTTFWQFNNIVPIISSIISAIIAVGIVYVNMVRRMDRQDARLERIEEKVNELSNTMKEYLKIRTQNQKDMQQYVIEIERLKACTRNVCQ